MTRIKALREARGITQESLAAQLGVSRSAVAMWEAGHNTPPTKILGALADILGCTVDALLEREPT